MNRADRFKALKTHPWFSKVYKKLSDEDLVFACKFILDNENLNTDEYISKLLKYWLDKPKPKNWTLIEDLLVASK